MFIYYHFMVKLFREHRPRPTYDFDTKLIIRTDKLRVSFLKTLHREYTLGTSDIPHPDKSNTGSGVSRAYKTDEYEFECPYIL